LVVQYPSHTCTWGLGVLAPCNRRFTPSRIGMTRSEWVKNFWEFLTRLTPQKSLTEHVWPSLNHTSIVYEYPPNLNHHTQSINLVKRRVSDINMPLLTLTLPPSYIFMIVLSFDNCNCNVKLKFGNIYEW